MQPADEKCSRCRGGRRCLLPVDSDNGHPACAECLISSHGCPNHVARSAPAKKKPTRSSKGKAKAGPSNSPVKCPQAFVMVPRLKPSGHPPADDEPAQPEAGPSTMPTALDFMVEFQSFRSRPMQERPTPGHGKLSVSSSILSSVDSRQIPSPISPSTWRSAALVDWPTPGRQRGTGSLPSRTSSSRLTGRLSTSWGDPAPSPLTRWSTCCRLDTLTACSQPMKNTVKGAQREKEMPESAPRATGFLGRADWPPCHVGFAAGAPGHPPSAARWKS